jgi:uncharacterized protein
MTVFNIAGLLHETTGATRDVRLTDHYVVLGNDLELAGPLNGAFRLQRTNRGVLVRGRVTAALRRTCARCLEPYVEEPTAAIEEEFVPSLDPETGATIAEPPADEGTRIINAHHEIDLAPVIHDELSLTEPMHPLCRPDCPGLCVVCGGPLEVGTHDHGDEEIDPRLAVLAQFRAGGDDT